MSHAVLLDRDLNNKQNMLDYSSTTNSRISQNLIPLPNFPVDTEEISDPTRQAEPIPVNLAVG